MNRIAVCLITCNRESYTRETVESFMDMNAGEPGFERFDLLHGDDASATKLNTSLADRAGFHLVVESPTRVGITDMIRRMAVRVQRAGQSHMLLLENDWKSVRPFPWELFDYFAAVPCAYTLRLTGQFKEWDDETNRGRRPFGTDHAGRGNKPVHWAPLMDAPEPAEMGSIHFGNPPGVTRIETLLWLLKGCVSENEVRQKSGSLEVGNDYTIRPAENVFYHIGAERTPGFVR